MIFKRLAEELAAEGSSTKIIINPPKSDAELDVNLKDKKPWEITDMLSATIICGSPEEMRETSGKLIRYLEEGGIRVAGVENRFGEGEDLCGYRDIRMLIEIPGSGGYLAELQIHASDIWLAREKGGGDDLYKALISARSDVEEDEIRVKMNNLYETAFDLWLSR